MGIDAFRTASPADAEAIATLVNAAYRPEPGASGWTHEAHLVAGNRSNANQVIECIAKQGSCVLLGLHGSDIVACVHLEKNGDDGYIGMLSVEPTLQGTGIGKQMLAYAENHAKTIFACKKLVMVVITARTELMSFYLRRGYKKTGSVTDFPQALGAGTPKHSGLKIEQLEKTNGL